MYVDTSSEDGDVVVKDIMTKGGKWIRHIVLNRTKKLNALNLDMVQLISSELEEASRNEDISCMFLESASTKAFCAGGDVAGVCQKVVSDGVTEAAEAFFAAEYALNSAMHRFEKPLIIWINGLCMGGGMGLSVAGNYRVVTNAAMFSMPEITIGLFPDVAASWFLNRMPRQTGLFAALTGARLNAADALYAGLADYFIPEDRHEAVWEELLDELEWGDPHKTVGTVMRRHSRTVGPLIESNIERCWLMLHEVLEPKGAEDIATNLKKLSDNVDPWLSQCGQSFQAGSPLSARLILAQLKKTRHASLEMCLNQEFIMVRHCLRGEEFFEGVRALLIDKDNSPKWQFSSVSDVPENEVEKYFLPLES